MFKVAETEVSTSGEGARPARGAGGVLPRENLKIWSSERPFPALSDTRLRNFDSKK